MKKCVILVGPSAVGKTTVGHAMLEMSDRYELVRSVTTREMRADSFGSEYHRCYWSSLFGGEIES